MNRFIKAGWILIGCFTLSCERNIELSVDLPGASAVLNASLSADSLITATVSRTVRAYYNGPEPLPVYFPGEASIEVFVNDSKQGVMEKGEKNGQYRLPGYYPSAGDKIRLEVQTAGFAPLSAEVCIPSRPEILWVDTQMYKKEASASFPGDNRIDVALRFKEPANETNYYMLALSEYFIEEKDTLTKTYLPVSVIHNEELLFEELSPARFPYLYAHGHSSNPSYYGYYDTSFFIFNDKAIHSDAYTLKFTLKNVFSSNDSDSSPFTAICRICLYAVSESCYLYYRSKLLQWKQAEDLFGSVGLREPVPTYTNVRNGYGLLSARQAAVYELKVPVAGMPLSVYDAD
ncbi:MAG: DUF4249 domain-containing protein [Tannerellaceae bacterium]|jgi:hypothetical protein|nr:DUF4249 domain-containing protein [Tannerellaceae bacterium]